MAENGEFTRFSDWLVWETIIRGNISQDSPHLSPAEQGSSLEIESLQEEIVNLKQQLEKMKSSSKAPKKKGKKKTSDSAKDSEIKALQEEISLLKQSSGAPGDLEALLKKKDAEIKSLNAEIAKLKKQKKVDTAKLMAEIQNLALINDQLSGKAEQLEEKTQEADFFSRKNDQLMIDMKDVFDKLCHLSLRTDAIGDTLIELNPDDALKAQMDSCQERFESLIQETRSVDLTPQHVKGLLDFIAEYEESILKQASNLTGLRPEETMITIESVKQPTSKISHKEAKKVRSAKPQSSRSYDKLEAGLKFLLKMTGDLVFEHDPNDPLLKEAEAAITSKEGSIADRLFQQEKVMNGFIKRIKEANEATKSELSGIMNKMCLNHQKLSKMCSLPDEMSEKAGQMTQTSQMLQFLQEISEKNAEMLEEIGSVSQLAAKSGGIFMNNQQISQLMSKTPDIEKLKQEFPGIEFASPPTSTDPLERTIQFLDFYTNSLKLTMAAAPSVQVSSSQSSELEHLRIELAELREKYDKLDEEFSDSNKTIRELKKSVRTKEEEIQDLKNQFGQKRRSSTRNSDDKLREEIHTLKEIIEKKSSEVSALNLELIEVRSGHQKLQDSVHDLEEQIRILKEKNDKLNVHKIKLDNENDELKNRISLGKGKTDEAAEKQILEDLQQKDAYLKQLKDQIGPLLKYRVIYLQIKAEYEELIVTNKELEDLVNSLRQQVNTLTHENEQLAYKSRMIEKYQRDYLAATKDIERLKKSRSYREYLDKNGENYTELIEKLNEDLCRNAEEARELSEKIQDYEGHVRTLKENKDRNLQRSMIRRLIRRIFQETDTCFRAWKQEAESINPSEKEKAHIVQLYTAPIEAQISEDFGHSSIKSTLVKDKTEALTNNPVLNFYKSSAVSVQEPTGKLNIIHTVEEAMLSKHEIDQNAYNRYPKTFPQFFRDHLIALYGKRAEVSRHLSAFVQGLHLSYNEKHPYITFMAKLLQMFDPDPILYQESVFLVTANALLTKNCEEAFRLRSDNPSVCQNEMPTSQYIEKGGEALIADVIKSLFELFRVSPESGASVLDLIKPPEIGPLDYTKLRTVLYLDYKSIDLDTAFAKSKGSLEKISPFCGSSENVQFNNIEEFKKALSPDLLDTVDGMVIPKWIVLNAISDTISKVRISGMAEVIQAYEARGNVPVNRDGLKEIVNEYDRSANDEIIDRMYSMGVYWSSEPEMGITPDALFKLFIRHGTGKFLRSPLYINTTNQEIKEEERKEQKERKITRKRK